MKFVLDENFPRRATELLQGLGHEVIDARDTDLAGSDDIDLFDFVQKHKAVLLTTDRDFFHTIPFLYQRHEGVVVIALSQPNAARIIDRLRWALDQSYIKKIANNCLLLTDRKVVFTSR